MKLTKTSESTTATPHLPKITIGRALALCGIGLPSVTAVTLPAAIHLLGHRSPALAVIVGVTPALPVVLVVAALVTTYLLVSAVAILTTAGRVIRGKSRAASCIDDLFAWIVNAPVSLLTLTPLKPPTRRARPMPKTPAVSALPAAPNAARKADERFYWETIQSQAATRPRGARDDVALPGDPITQPIKMPGRHARPDAVPVAEMPDSRIAETV